MFLLVFFICLNFSRAFGSTRKGERYYQVEWCDARNGIMEVVLSDRTRADCVTDDEIAEFDFARKWAEGIGQILNYVRLTDKKGVLVLICGTPNDYFKANKVSKIISRYQLPFRVETIER